MSHAKTQRRKGSEFRAASLFFAPLRLCVRCFPVGVVITMTGCIPASVPRTPEVSGRVYDARTKKPVTGAIVTFENAPKIATETDEEGAFILQPHTKFGFRPILPFDALPCRTILLIKHEGYHDYSSWIWLVKPNSGVKAVMQPNN